MNRYTLSEWLKKYHHNDRTWLANKCNRSINTVYTWFSSRPIPKDAQIIIGKLMREDQSKQLQNQELPRNMVVEFTKEENHCICEKPFKNAFIPKSTIDFTEKEWANIVKLAQREGYESVKEWILQKIRAYVAMTQQPQRQGAEDPAEYKTAKRDREPTPHEIYLELQVQSAAKKKAQAKKGE